MIRSLRGTIASVTSPNVVVEVGGIGFLVTVTRSHAASLYVSDEVVIETAFVVRDDGFTLFGFPDGGQRELFDTLTAVSGVGPKLAMAVLNELSPAQIAAAVHAENDAVFRAVSGIGPKMAKLIVVSLAGRVDFVAPEPVALGEVADPVVVEEVTVALVGLGWKRDAALRAVEEVAAAGKSVAVTLRESLAVLGGEARG